MTRDQLRYRRNAEKERIRKRNAYRAKKGQVRPYTRRAPVVAATKGGRSHGLRTTYNAGCRCRWCRAADAAYRGWRNEMRRAA